MSDGGAEVIGDLTMLDPVLANFYPSMELTVRVGLRTQDYDLLNLGTPIGTLDAVIVDKAASGDPAGMNAVLFAVDQILAVRKAQLDPVAEGQIATARGVPIDSQIDAHAMYRGPSEAVDSVSGLDSALANTAILTGERKAAYDEFAAATHGVDDAQKEQAAAMERYKRAIARLSRAALGDAE